MMLSLCCHEPTSMDEDNRSIIRGGKLLPAYKQLWAECLYNQ